MSGRRILLVGGAGVFGARLAEGLAAALPGCTVLVAGRNLARAERTVADLRARYPEAALEALALDREGATAEALRATGAAVVVDAAGPFQNARPALAEASIAAGIDYLDLADARDFVWKFHSLDAAAQAAGVLAVTGVSSTPTLSHAALDMLVEGWRRIDSIEVGIAPGNRMPRGVAVVQAILSWVGQPVRVFMEGRWQQRRGWSGTRLQAIDGLRYRRPLALADVPDLDLLVERYAPRDSAVFRAGLEVPLLHYGLAFLGWLVPRTRIGNLSRWAKPLHRMASWCEPLGSDRGGMIVEALGRDGDDRPALARWIVVAPAGRGPNIPVLPALALIRRLLDDRPSLGHGARTGAGLLTLAEIAAEFPRIGLTTALHRQQLVPVTETLLPQHLASLPQPLISAHTGGPITRLKGEATVEGAEKPIGRVLARLFGMPATGGPMPVTVTMRLQEDGSELWVRDFAGQRMASHFTGLGPGRATERFGPMTFDLSVEREEGDGLIIRIIGWRLGPLPLPRRLALGSVAREGLDAEGRFTFDVLVRLPWIGRLVHYRGWLREAG